MSQTRPRSHDLALLRRFRAGGVGVSTETAELLTRVLWIHARLWEETAAPRQLARSPSLRAHPASHTVHLHLAMVRASDAADSSPSGTSAEFVWRHPELVAALRAALAGVGSENPPTPPHTCARANPG